LHLEMITQNTGLWAYLLLALLVMVEGPVATLAGAVAAASGFMVPEGVFIAAATGNLLADTLWYTLGYLGKMEWLTRYGRFVGVTPALVARFQRDIEQHVGKLLLVAKLTLGFSIPALIATGLSRVPVRRWFPWLALGETIWTGALVFLGYHLGRYITRLERGVEMAAAAGILLSAAFLVFYLGKLRKDGHLGKKAAAGTAAATSAATAAATAAAIAAATTVADQRSKLYDRP
jgi:membrane protein DedA with SNARE-associated domain